MEVARRETGKASDRAQDSPARIERNPDREGERGGEENEPPPPARRDRERGESEREGADRRRRLERVVHRSQPDARVALVRGVSPRNRERDRASAGAAAWGSALRAPPGAGSRRSPSGNETTRGPREGGSRARSRPRKRALRQPPASRAKGTRRFATGRRTPRGSPRRRSRTGIPREEAQEDPRGGRRRRDESRGFERDVDAPQQEREEHRDGGLHPQPPAGLDEAPRLPPPPKRRSPGISGGERRGTRTEKRR